jgi:hypothetical protein
MKMANEMISNDNIRIKILFLLTKLRNLYREQRAVSCSRAEHNVVTACRLWSGWQERLGLNTDREKYCVSANWSDRMCTVLAVILSECVGHSTGKYGL